MRCFVLFGAFFWKFSRAADAVGDDLLNGARVAYGASTVVAGELPSLHRAARSSDVLSAALSAQKLVLESKTLDNIHGFSSSVAKAISASQASASAAVEAVLSAAEALAQVEKYLSVVDACVVEAATKSAEVAVFVAAARAAADAGGGESQGSTMTSAAAVSWSSAAGTDRWLVEEVYPHRRVGAAKDPNAAAATTPLFFVDVGANDGVSMSQTHALEKHFAWSGICVEASDAPFQALELSRPLCVNVNACLSNSSGASVSFAVDTSILMQDERAFSGMYSGIVDTNTAMRSGWSAEAAPQITKTTSLLADVLRKHHAPHFIEFLSLDCEGCELGLLSTFPFGEPWIFGAIVLEHNSEEQTRRDMRSVLERHGYVRVIADATDDAYVINDPSLVPLAASVLPPFTNATHRQRLIQAEYSYSSASALFSNISTSSSSSSSDAADNNNNNNNGFSLWACPLDLSTVLSGGSSGACPLPSSDQGYGHYTLDDRSRHVRRMGLCNDPNQHKHRHNTDYANSQSSSSFGAFGDTLLALGFNLETSTSVAEMMVDAARAPLCLSEDSSLLTRGAEGDTAADVNIGAVVSFAVIPGYVTRIGSLGTTSNFVTIPLQDATENEEASTNTRKGSWAEPSEGSVRETIARACTYLAVSEDQCENLTATVSPSLSAFREVLATGKDASSFTEGGLRAEVFKVYLYLDACLENNDEEPAEGSSSPPPPPPSSSSSVFTITRDPDRGCVSEAWSLGLVRLEDEDPSSPMKLTIQPLDRPFKGGAPNDGTGGRGGEVSDGNLLKRAAAAGFGTMTTAPLLLRSTR